MKKVKKFIFDEAHRPQKTENESVADKFQQLLEKHLPDEILAKLVELGINDDKEHAATLYNPGQDGTLISDLTIKISSQVLGDPHPSELVEICFDYPDRLWAPNSHIFAFNEKCLYLATYGLERRGDRRCVCDDDGNIALSPEECLNETPEIVECVLEELNRVKIGILTVDQVQELEDHRPSCSIS